MREQKDSSGNSHNNAAQCETARICVFPVPPDRRDWKQYQKRSSEQNNIPVYKIKVVVQAVTQERRQIYSYLHDKRDPERPHSPD